MSEVARTGTVAVELDALSLLVRLCASVPPPKMHLVRYSGVLSAAHKLRPLVVPPLPAQAAPPGAPAHVHGGAEKPATHRCHYWSWAALMKRSFGIDADKCDRCGARMKLRALVIAAASIPRRGLPRVVERFLRHIGEPVEPPVLSPARGPPFFQSRAVRRKLGELDGVRGQVEMFGA